METYLPSQLLQCPHHVLQVAALPGVCVGEQALLHVAQLARLEGRLQAHAAATHRTHGGNQDRQGLPQKGIRAVVARAATSQSLSAEICSNYVWKLRPVARVQPYSACKLLNSRLSAATVGFETRADTSVEDPIRPLAVIVLDVQEKVSVGFVS